MMPLDRETLEELTRDLEGSKFSGWILVGRRDDGGIDLRWSGDQPPAVTLPGLSSQPFQRITEAAANSNASQFAPELNSPPTPSAQSETTKVANPPTSYPNSPVFRAHDRDFDRNGHNVVVADVTEQLPSEGSLFMSFNVANAQPAQGLLSCDSHGFGSGGHVSLWVAGGRVNARMQDQVREYMIQSRPMLKNDMTHSLLLSFGDRGMSLWVDGEDIGLRDYHGGLAGNPNPIILGALSWSATPGTAEPLEHFMGGTIHDCVIVDKQMTPRDIPELLAFG